MGVRGGFVTDDVADLARVMFNAYGEHAEWKSWDGRPMPKWSKDDWPSGTPDDDRREINDAVRSHWIAAAAAALGKTLRRYVPMSPGYVKRPGE